MRSSQVSDDIGAEQEYARARRAAALATSAAVAASAAGGSADRAGLDRLGAALEAADRSLASADPVRLALRTAYLERVAAQASRYRLRREPWADSLRTACRHLGPRDDLVTRLRAASVAVGEQPSAGEVRRLEGALHTLHEAMERSGGSGPAVTLATWRLAKWYRQLFLAEPLARTVARTVDRLPVSDPLTCGAGGRAAGFCGDVGQVETARDLYAMVAADAEQRLAGQHGTAARAELAAVRLRMADHHLLNGAAVRAEALVRTVSDTVAPRAPASATERRAAADLARTRAAALALLPDCLLAQGRRSEAHAAYCALYERLTGAARHTPRTASAASAAYRAVLYTGREWHREGPPTDRDTA
ncbi:hypothetical protein ACMA1D_25075 [Streptomyces sp. 796.1]|uniref:hypothetical protein n=1 Tax=Streptomyces sp. 796.1 TaxID=3163029 RepID=UPI0039C90187